ncbi:MAG: hypothetical protein ABSE83_11940 [Methanobacterium sp.]
MLGSVTERDIKRCSSSSYGDTLKNLADLKNPFYQTLIGGINVILQLIKLEEHINGIDKDVKSFILTFEDDELINQALPLLMTRLKNYKPYENVEVRAELTITGNGNFIKLYVIYPESNMNISNRELEDDLEKMKNDFEQYYTKFIKKIKLIPVLK